MEHGSVGLVATHEVDGRRAARHRARHRRGATALLGMPHVAADASQPRRRLPPLGVVAPDAPVARDVLGRQRAVVRRHHAVRAADAPLPPRRPPPRPAGRAHIPHGLSRVVLLDVHRTPHHERQRARPAHVLAQPLMPALRPSRRQRARQENRRGAVGHTRPRRRLSLEEGGTPRGAADAPQRHVHPPEAPLLAGRLATSQLHLDVPLLLRVGEVGRCALARRPQAAPPVEGRAAPLAQLLRRPDHPVAARPPDAPRGVVHVHPGGVRVDDRALLRAARLALVASEEVLVNVGRRRAEEVDEGCGVGVVAGHAEHRRTTR